MNDLEKFCRDLLCVAEDCGLLDRVHDLEMADGGNITSAEIEPVVAFVEHWIAARSKQLPPSDLTEAERFRFAVSLMSSKCEPFAALRTESYQSAYDMANCLVGGRQAKVAAISNHKGAVVATLTAVGRKEYPQ